jgi:hypothetical protein
VTTKAKEDVKATEAPAPAAQTKPTTVEEKKADKPAKPEKAPGECVVDDGTLHNGRATPGAKICSAHAMRYKADGTPR